MTPQTDPMRSMTALVMPRIAQMGTVCIEVLEQMGFGVVACDAELTVALINHAASRILSRLGSDTVCAPGTALPRRLAEAIEGPLEGTAASGRPVPPLRLRSADGRATVYVSVARVERLAPASVVVWMHEEVVRDEDLLSILRSRFRVSTRDLELINLVRLGHSNKYIAQSLGLTEGTVKVYLHELYGRLGVHSRLELLRTVEHLRHEQ